MKQTASSPDALEHLGERVERAATLLRTLRADRDRLTAERNALAGRLAALEQALAGRDAGALLEELQGLRGAARAWREERRAMAARIDAVVKSLERLE